MLVRKYIKIKAYASIYDGKLSYFSERMSLHNARMKRLWNLMKKQGKTCALCNLEFRPDDVIELHHVLNEEKKRTKKLQFVHGHCHDALHGVG
jgi:RNA-directed DNA polymerase